MGFFSFWKKKEIELEILNCIEIESDIHAHWLPGIDDGAKNIEESIEIISYLKNLGFKRLVATPHVMSDFFNNSTQIIQEKLQLVKDAVAKAGLDVELFAAAEYNLDEEFVKRIANKDLLTLPNTNIVLFELSYINQPNNLKVVVKDLFVKGYQPLLAHPERYPYYADDISKYEELKDMGVQMQVNLMSLAGHYGPQAKHIARYLIDKNWVDFVGTDIHKKAHSSSIEKALQTEEVRNLCEWIKNKAIK
jgi:protein-tyrosine phosphatase